MPEKTTADILKTAISTTDIVTAGKLNTAQAKQFITYMQEETEIFNLIQFKRMSTLHGVAYDLDTSRRMIRKGVEGVAPDNYGTIKIGQNEIDLAETILPFDITDQFKKENIEQKMAATKIMKLMATQYGNDLQDLAINGDANAQNTNASAAHYFDVTDDELEFFTIYNGWIALLKNATDKHIVEETYNEADGGYRRILRNTFKSLPSRWKKSKDLKIFTTWDVIEGYVYELTGRITIMGDNKLLQGDNAPTFMGRKFVGVSTMPEKTLLLSSPKNLAFGIFTDGIKTEYERNARKRQDEYTVTADTGCQIANYDSLVYTEFE